MRKLKVVILTTCFPRKSNLGNGIFIFQQIRALAELGVECHVIQPIQWFPPFGLHKFHPYWETGYKQAQDVRNDFSQIKMHHPRVFARFPGRFFKDEHWERMGKSVASYIANHKELKGADLIYAHFMCNEGYAATYIKQMLNIPLVAIARGDDVHEWPEKDPEAARHLKVVFKHADLLLANSGRLAADTKQWMDSSQVHDVSVVYNGVDVSKFNPVNTKEEKYLLRKKYGMDPSLKYMICVATPVVLKGWVELLEAWSGASHLISNWRLIAVAPRYPYPDAINLVSLAEDFGIIDQCVFYEGLPHDQLIELYQASDVFTLPSYNEGMSNALLEALACGLPVLATDVGGHAEVVKSGESGYLFPPKSVSSLKEALNKVVSLSDQKLKQMQVEARAAAIQIGTYKDNAQRLLDLFNKLLSRN